MLHLGDHHLGKFKNDSSQSLFLAAHRKWGNTNDFKALARGFVWIFIIGVRQ